MPHTEPDIPRSLLGDVPDGETDPGERRPAVVAGNGSARHLFRVVPTVAVASPAAMRRQAVCRRLAAAGS